VIDLYDGWHYYTTRAPALPVTNVTVALSGAVAPATAGLVWESQPGEIHPRLQATLRIRPNVAVVERVIEGAMKRQWQDELNETGSASMEIPNEHVDATTINEGNVVVFADEGWTVFGWIVKEIERVQIARGEESEQVTTFSGVGLLGLLAEAVVYPPRGVGRTPATDERYFSWFSPDYEAQWFWPQATMLGKWRDMTTLGPIWIDSKGNPLPEDWPDPDAQWIWGPGTSTTAAPIGDCYFAGEFIVPPGVDMIELFVASDNNSVIYFDGQEMGKAQWDREDTVAWEKTIEVTPGEHYIAIKATNIPMADAIAADIEPVGREAGPAEGLNPGGVLCTVYATDGLDLIGNPLYQSHDGWRVLAYPSTPPGMTPGMAMWHCVYEALLRGTLSGLRIAFNDESDSDGNPWPVYGDISTKIGTDYLTFFRELCATYVDMWMEPASFTLHAWVKGMRGSQRADVELRPVTDPNNPWSGNLAGLTYRIAE
jgi:hypothetical protein